MQKPNTLIILCVTALTAATALVWGQNATPLPPGAVSVQMGPTKPAPTDAQRDDLKSKQLALVAPETAVTPTAA